MVADDNNPLNWRRAGKAFPLNERVTSPVCRLFPASRGPIINLWPLCPRGRVWHQLFDAKT